MKRKILPVIMAGVMTFGVLPLTAMAQDNIEVYPAVGGNIYFSTETGTITLVDEGVTEVNIPAAIKDVEVVGIDKDAFIDCREITAVNAAEDSKAFVSEDGILFNKDKTVLIEYPASKEGEVYAVPEGVTEIADSAFMYVFNMKSITLPESLTTIGSEAFWSCSGLTEITLPAGLTKIGDSAFGYNGNLAAVKVAEGNTAFSAENGLLYNKDKTELVLYPTGQTDGTVKIPEGVKVIGSYALSDNYNISSVEIPEGVETIKEYAFAGSEEFPEVKIPSTLKTVEKFAFAGANSLKTVYYNGTEAQWRAITIDNTEDGNILLVNAEKHFSEENPVTADPNAVYVFVNQAELVSDQPAVIVNDRTLVPLRAIFEALGATVDWDDATRTVTSEKDGVKISLKIGENILYRNDEAIEIDVPAQIINDRTMVPVRAISEAYGCEVGWDGASRTVTIEG